MSTFLGQYECTQYIGGPDENDWHHVTVSMQNHSHALVWKNRAGVQWLLLPVDGEPDSLMTGDESPYPSVKFPVIRSEDGSVQTLVFNGENYDRKMRGFQGPRGIRNDIVHLSLPSARADSVTCFVHNIKLEEGEVDWRDLFFLAAIPTNTFLNEGKPAMIVDDESPEDDDAIQDLLTRLAPRKVVHFVAQDEVSQGMISPPSDGSAEVSVHETAGDLAELCSFLADLWKEKGPIPRAVVVKEGNYGAALLASSLASRIRAPLFFNNVGHIETNEVLEVGDGTSLPDVHAVLTWLESNGFDCSYLAITNPDDRSAGSVRKLSLTAPMYTARRGGLVVPIVTSMTDKPQDLNSQALQEMKAALQEVYRTLGSKLPRYLALVGSCESVPACLTDHDVNACGDYAICDLPYARRDFDLADDFFEIGVSRIFTHSVTLASLLATRTCHYETLRRDAEWSNRVVECGDWGWINNRIAFESTGYTKAGCQPDLSVSLLAKDINALQYIEAAAIMHMAHSGWSCLGNAWDLSTKVLTAPAVMLSSGCHACGIDEGYPSCGSRIIGRGAVCYSGAPRCPTTAARCWEVAFVNQLLYHHTTIGDAVRLASNKLMVHHLHDAAQGRYTLENRLVLGDPGLRALGPLNKESKDPLRTRAKAALYGDELTVVGPGKCGFVATGKEQLREWSYPKESLYVPTGADCEIESNWSGRQCDDQQLFFVVALSVPGPVNSLTFVEGTQTIENERGKTTSHDFVSRWGPSDSRFFQHQHPSTGVYTFFCRMKVLEYDEVEGKPLATMNSAIFKLEHDGDWPVEGDAMEPVKRIFRDGDLNGDGLMSLEEMTQVLRAQTPLSDEEIAFLFRSFDVDGDGLLSYTEFCDWLGNDAKRAEEMLDS